MANDRAPLDAAARSARRPVWVALSELFLDNELDAAALDRIAAVLAASSLSIDELRAVFVDELTPALSSNLASPAGEWAGFDEDWLCARIEETIAKRRPASALVRLVRAVAAVRRNDARFESVLEQVVARRG